MKYNKGFATIVILGIILGILVVGGGVYYLGKNKGEKKEVVNIDQLNRDIEKKGIKTQINVNAGYQIEYPSDWYVKISDTTMSASGYNSFVIQNTKDAVLSGSDFGLKTDGSYINISVNNNMNYSNYEEFMKDPKTDLPKSAKEARLAKLKMINIGGKILQAFGGEWDGTTLPGDSYDFVYNKKLYSLGFESGSKEQYYKDKNIFDNMVSSFKFLDSEESTISKNNVTNQPAYLNAAYTKDGMNYIDVDYLQMFATSDERIKAMIEDGVCSNVKDCYDFPNGYKRNTNPLVRTFEVGNNIPITIGGLLFSKKFDVAYSTNNNGSNYYKSGDYYNDYVENQNNHSSTFVEFKNLVSLVTSYLPYKTPFKKPITYIVIDIQNNIATKIIEPYQE